MKALILNSGVGKRMGNLTSDLPKCMTRIDGEHTILSRQLYYLEACKVQEIIITTGPFREKLVEYCESLGLNLRYTFVDNPLYKETNYIYSIYLAREYVSDDMILMHGDLVFDKTILEELVSYGKSLMAVSSTSKLPEKDFKAVIKNEKIVKVGIEFFENAVTAQPLYYMKSEDWNIWMDQMIYFCKKGITTCYAEVALNEVTNKCNIFPLDIKNRLCNEIDDIQDLNKIQMMLGELQ